MLGIDGAALVLWLHVLAACVWIGGQVVIAAVIPLLRGSNGIASRAGARFQAVAWPAFALLIITGVLNARNAGIGWGDLLTTPVGRTLTVKLGFVLLSGAAAAVHAFVQGPRARHASASAMASAVLG